MVWDSILLGVFSNFAKLVPFRLHIVYSYQQGVKFRFGKDVKLLGPGVHFRWGFFERIDILNTVPEIVETQPLTLVTTDGKSVSVSVGVRYATQNARLLLTQVQDFAPTLLNMIEAETAKAVPQYTLEELLTADGNEQLCTEVAAEAREKALVWGVFIEGVYLINLAPCKVLRLISNAPVA